MPVDVAQKKDDEIQLIGSWDLGVLFQKVLPAGHNAGQVIIKYFFKLLKKSLWISSGISQNFFRFFPKFRLDFSKILSIFFYFFKISMLSRHLLKILKTFLIFLQTITKIFSHLLNFCEISFKIFKFLKRLNINPLCRSTELQSVTHNFFWGALSISHSKF